MIYNGSEWDYAPDFPFFSVRMEADLIPEAGSSFLVVVGGAGLLGRVARGRLKRVSRS